MSVKRLYRSKINRIVAGVLGGLGEYLEVDPVVLRLFFLAVVIFTGVIPGLVVYLLAIVIVPINPALLMPSAHDQSGGVHHS